MKRCILAGCGLVLALALFAFGALVGGCDQSAKSEPVSEPATNQTQASDAAAPGSNTPVPTDPMDQKLVDASGTIISTAATSPPDTSNNPQLNEVVKLVQAGVGESVLMAFVTNSPSPFNVSSGDAVYLNDLGVSQEVVSAMLQRDQYFTSAAAQAPVQPGYPGSAPAPPGYPGAAPVPPTYANPTSAPQAPPPDQTAAPPTSDQVPTVMNEETPPPNPSSEAIDDAEQATNAAYSYFYDSLSPYGNWIDVDGYGPCWQPTVNVVNPGWQPYCNSGHWVYTDCGWCWVSDYSWGWAPFHYGRWFHHSRWGWCWAPDTVWGPAWVSWRYNAGYCGWAALPPTACYRPGFGFTFFGQSVGFNFTFGLGPEAFVFVPLGHFQNRTLTDFRIEPRDAGRIFPTTTINNQLIRGANNALINRGVPVERVAAATRMQIRPVHIRTDLAAPGAPQFGRNGVSLSIYRPALPLPRLTAKPTLVGEGVQRDLNFDLQSHVEQAQQRQFVPPPDSSAPDRRPIISNPTTVAPRDENRTEVPQNNGVSSPEWRSAPGRVDNAVPNQWPNYQRSPGFQPQQPAPPPQDNRRVLVPQQPAPRYTPPQSQQRGWPEQPNSPVPRQEQPRQEQPRQEIAPRGYEEPRNYESPRSAPPVESAPARQESGQSGGGNGNNNGNGSANNNGNGGYGGGAAGGGGRGH